MRLTFKETSIFTRQVTELLSEEELNALQWALTANPESGDLIRGSGGLMLLAYPKNELENLTSAQLKTLKSIIDTEFP